MRPRLVFLSSSGDLAETRKHFDREFGRWNSLLGQTELQSKTYLWEMDEVLKDLDDREPIQGQLTRTDGDEVLLTVGLFGERCGVPLADGVRLGRDFATWTMGSFRLLHPWPAGVEASETALNDGCYPLTGTIFEQLCAIDAAMADPDRSKPFIGYVANCYVAPDTKLGDVLFNGFLLNDRTLKGKTTAERDVLKPVLERQRRGLLNYLNALHASGKIEPIRFDSAEAMCDALLERTKSVVLPLAQPLDGSTGYRNALTFYDIRDSYPLPGLQAEADLAANGFWNDAFGDGASAAKRTLLLTGPSGCGKSSYMRRGILGSLVREKKQKAIAIAFRPNDLDPHVGGNCLWRLWRLILASDPRITTNFMMDPAQTEASGEAAIALTQALARIDARLLLGIDQFEEFLDILFRDSGSDSTANRLRPTFVFLRACLEGGRVAIVATLETQRDALREDFADAEFGWWMDRTKSLHLDEERVWQIADAPLKAAGLPPDKDALRRIVVLWKKLKEGTNAEASTLPLLGLWLARLQDRNRYLARKSGKDLTEKFRNASDEPVLNLGHIDDMPPMSHLIDELARTAWLEEAQSYGGVENRDGKKVPRKVDVNNFLQPFVGLSRDGGKELRNVARTPIRTLSSVLIKRFVKSRLMVPVLAGRQDTVRLTHQAVIDRWEAGAEWFRDFETYLTSERRLLSKAEGWHHCGRTALQTASETDIGEAASVLDMLRDATNQSLSPEYTLLREYAIEVFRHSKTPLALVPHTLLGTLHVHVAATYDLADVLEAWLRAPDANVESIVNAKDANLAGPLKRAAWSSPTAVATLLRHGVRVKDPELRKFHPICGPVQSGREDILDMLIGYYRIDEAVCEEDDRTMLHHAAQTGQLAILRHLIRLEASPDVGDRVGQTPLMYAAANGNLDITLELRTPERALARMNKENGSYRAIDLAAMYGRWKIIDLLLTTPGLTKEDRTLMLGPCVAGQVSPLGLAAASLRPGTVRWFLEHPDIDPAGKDHLKDGYGNLAEWTAAAADRDIPGYDERLRDTLEVLLNNSRIDPTAVGKNGKSLHQLVAHSGPAGRLVNGHARCPRNWKALTARAALDQIREAHQDEALRIAQQRPDLLLDETVLPKVSKAAWPAVAPLLAGWVNLRTRDGPRMIEALYKNYPFDDAPKDAVKAALLGLLIDRIDPKNRAKSGGPLLALVAAKGTADEIGRLLEKRVPLDRPLGPLGSRPVHLAVQRSDKATFELLAKAMRGQPAPRDDWGRVPSEVAPKPDRSGIATLEATYFKAEA